MKTLIKSQACSWLHYSMIQLFSLLLKLFLCLARKCKHFVAFFVGQLHIVYSHWHWINCRKKRFTLVVNKTATSLILSMLICPIGTALAQASVPECCATRNFTRTVTAEVTPYQQRCRFWSILLTLVINGPFCGTSTMTKLLFLTATPTSVDLMRRSWDCFGTEIKHIWEMCTFCPSVRMYQQFKVSKGRELIRCNAPN